MGGDGGDRAKGFPTTTFPPPPRRSTGRLLTFVPRTSLPPRADRGGGRGAGGDDVSRGARSPVEGGSGARSASTPGLRLRRLPTSSLSPTLLFFDLPLPRSPPLLTRSLPLPLPGSLSLHWSSPSLNPSLPPPSLHFSFSFFLFPVPLPPLAKSVIENVKWSRPCTATPSRPTSERRVTGDSVEESNVYVLCLWTVGLWQRDKCICKFHLESDVRKLLYFKTLKVLLRP